MKLLLLTLLAIASAASFSAETSRSLADSDYRHDFSVLVNLGVQNGGQEMVSVYDTSTGAQTDSVRAGGFWVAGIGAQIPIGPAPFSVQIGTGVIYNDSESNVNTSNSRFQRQYVDGLLFWHTGIVRLGGGITQHIAPTFTWDSATDNAQDIDIEFDDASGIAVQMDVRFSQNLMIGLRGNVISYDTPNQNFSYTDDLGNIVAVPLSSFYGEKVSANSIGLHFTMMF